jgi:acetylornithine/N-succinyldiaminopimelate aminotransferase
MKVTLIEFQGEPAIEFDKEIGQSVRESCMKHGILVNNVKPNAIRIMPALTITRREIDEALGIFDIVLAKA